MSINKKENNKYLGNFLSLCILIGFIICECLYFNVIFVSDFKTKIDNLPNNIYSFIDDKIKNVLMLNDNQDNNYIFNGSNKEVDSISKNEETIPKLDITTNVQDTNDLVENDISIVKDDKNVKNLESTSIIDYSEDCQEEYTPIREKRLKYSTVDLNYFNNSLFIGDSRMAGFEIYKKLPGASYFCYSSASVFNIFDKEDTVDGYGSIKLFDLLSKHKFDKIYIMLGINNLQADYYSHKVKYKEMLDTISILQPSAIIYVIANFHITDVEDTSKPYLNNKNIDDINNFIKDFADNSQVFYLDSNPMYDDENGNLKLELSTDNIHIHIVHYDKFLVYLLSNALVEDTSQNNVIIP